MVTTTTQYSFQKPTVGDDEDVWGGYLNSNFDSIDSLLRGSTALSTINVTGNITVGGTVDGRDVASDGTKLDGIEAGATADQTAAEIRSLVESATDSNVFTDADHTKLNGIEAGATADQTKADIDALGIAASTASTLATARNIAVTGAVTGNANFDGSGNISISTTATSDPTVTLTGAVTGSGTMTNLGNVSIATTATADPTLTLNGDASGSATFTNLGNATLTVTVANDSHTHDGRYYTESEADSRFVNVTGDTMTGDLKINKSAAAIYLNDSSGSPTQQGMRIRAEAIDSALPGSEGIGIIFEEDPANGSPDTTPAVITTGEFYAQSSNLVWHAGNDGSGSGLDADTVDGIQASSFLRSDAADSTASTISFTGDIQVGDQIFHHGDTNTYLQFHAVDQWRVVTGGAERLEVNNSRTFIDRLYVDAGVVEDYEGLSGTSVTCNVNNGGAFGLTMTGNTTFTFTAPWSTADSVGFILELTGNGSTVTWPSSVDWAGGTAPDAPASGETDIYVFWTRDGGTTWYGVQSIDAAA